MTVFVPTRGQPLPFEQLQELRRDAEKRKQRKQQKKEKPCRKK